MGKTSWTIIEVGEWAFHVNIDFPKMCVINHIPCGVETIVIPGGDNAGKCNGCGSKVPDEVREAYNERMRDERDSNTD